MVDQADVDVALEKSIEHWKRMRNGSTRETPHGVSCALCDIFVRVSFSCSECPVMARTGEGDCEGSPWFKAFSHSYRCKVAGEYKFSPECPECQRVTTAEIEFLESLRRTKESVDG